MSLAVVYSRANVGIHAPLVNVETHLSFGAAKLNIVGLPEKTVKESKDRVRSAILNSKFDFPNSHQITINLAPADLPKHGGQFDLPIAIGILAATGQIPSDELCQYEFIGELALSGELRAILGAIPLALATKNAGRILILPQANNQEVGLIQDCAVLSAHHLLDVCQHFSKHQRMTINTIPAVPELPNNSTDFAEVQGQSHAKRALTIAAAGMHSVLMVGPPGTGKTMLAARLPGIMPPLSDHEALEHAAVLSIAQKTITPEQWRVRPFRSPHHSASSVALIGGGNPPKPGEISLAHHGVLFLDELTEFNRHVIESLREPIESGKILISRAAKQAEFPAKFQLIAAMNPCPCGYFGDPQQACYCSPDKVQRYLAKLSAPFLDRIDIHLEVPRVQVEIGNHYPVEPQERSEHIRKQVIAAQQIAIHRAKKLNFALNSQELTTYCPLAKTDYALLNTAAKKFQLSLRSIHKTLKVARTISDLAQSEMITQEHLLEALGFRRKFSAVKS